MIEPPGCQVVVCWAEAGGVGKSATSHALARGLAQLGAETVLLEAGRSNRDHRHRLGVAPRTFAAEGVEVPALGVDRPPQLWWCDGTTGLRFLPGWDVVPPPPTAIGDVLTAIDRARSAGVEWVVLDFGALVPHDPVTAGVFEWLDADHVVWTLSNERSKTTSVLQLVENISNADWCAEHGFPVVSADRHRFVFFEADAVIRNEPEIRRDARPHGQWLGMIPWSSKWRLLAEAGQLASGIPDEIEVASLQLGSELSGIPIPTPERTSRLDRWRRSRNIRPVGDVGSAAAPVASRPGGPTVEVFAGPAVEASAAVSLTGLRALCLVAMSADATTADIAANLALHRRDVKRELKALESEGLTKQISGHWFLGDRCTTDVDALRRLSDEATRAANPAAIAAVSQRIVDALARVESAPFGSSTDSAWEFMHEPAGKSRADDAMQLVAELCEFLVSACHSYSSVVNGSEVADTLTTLSTVLEQDWLADTAATLLTEMSPSGTKSVEPPALHPSAGGSTVSPRAGEAVISPAQDGSAIGLAQSNRLVNDLAAPSEDPVEESLVGVADSTLIRAAAREADVLLRTTGLQIEVAGAENLSAPEKSVMFLLAEAGRPMHAEEVSSVTGYSTKTLANAIPTGHVLIARSSGTLSLDDAIFTDHAWLAESVRQLQAAVKADERGRVDQWTRTAVAGLQMIDTAPYAAAARGKDHRAFGWVTEFPDTGVDARSAAESSIAGSALTLAEVWSSTGAGTADEDLVAALCHLAGVVPYAAVREQIPGAEWATTAGECLVLAAFRCARGRRTLERRVQMTARRLVDRDLVAAAGELADELGL